MSDANEWVTGCVFCYLEREANHIEQVERGFTAGDATYGYLRIAGLALYTMRSAICMRVEPCEAHDSQEKRILRERVRHEQARKLGPEVGK